eukprot:6190946-Pleurochrysis_carterae.AAC.2
MFATVSVTGAALTRDSKADSHADAEISRADAEISRALSASDARTTQMKYRVSHTEALIETILMNYCDQNFIYVQTC